MTVEITARSEYRAQLRALSGALQDVHRALIEFSRERYELANGPVRGRGALLELLLGDDAFTWLGPLSGLIAEIDELAARDPAPSAAETAAIRARADALISSSGDPDALGSRYVALLISEPRVAMNHGELRARMRDLPDPLAAVARELGRDTSPE
jgi:hypothetical protein